MKKSSKKKPLIRVCPKCGSRDVASPMGTKAFSPGYLCRNCGFYSTLFPQVGLKEAKKLDKNSIKFSRFHHKKVRGPGIILLLFTLFVLILIFLFWVSAVLNKL